MNLIKFGAVALMVVSVNACDKANDSHVEKTEAAPPSVKAELAHEPAQAKPELAPETLQNTTSTLGVAKVESVKVKVDGYGLTPAAATADAMRNAVLQVNGANVDMAPMEAFYAFDAINGHDAVSLRTSEFSEGLSIKSSGAISNFKVESIEDPKAKDGQYKVTIQANVAHYNMPADSKKLKLVIAPIHVAGKNFTVGDTSVSSSKVAADLRSKISSALNSTGRFEILERDTSPEIERELDMIESGQVSKSDLAKLSAASSADIVWIGTINRLAYNRHAQALRVSERSLVSYSGGWGFSQKLVSVATRQVVLADSFSGQVPSTEPTTMSTGVNGSNILANMEEKIVNEAVSSILIKAFPVAIASRTNNDVILNQGQNVLKVGERYNVVILGKDIKDPQTSESLGRLETPCCEVVIDKVAAKLAYGHFENIASPIDKVADSDLQLRGKVKADKVAVQQQSVVDKRVKAAASSSSNKKLSNNSTKESVQEDVSASIQSLREDDKW